MSDRECEYFVQYTSKRKKHFLEFDDLLLARVVARALAVHLGRDVEIRSPLVYGSLLHLTYTKTGASW